MGEKLAAARQQDNVLQKAQGAVARAVLVVDVAVHMIGIRQVDELGAGFEVAVIPAVNT